MMTFLPALGSGRIADYDYRSPHVRLMMWLMKHSSKRFEGLTLYGETITGTRKWYIGCTFKHCKFENMKYIFINNCIIEFEPPVVNLANMNRCEIKGNYLKPVPPLKRD